MGINNSISAEKQEACKRILELLSTPEGQTAFIEDLSGGISCLTDYEQQEDLMPHGVDELIGSGYIYNVLFPSKTVEYLGGYVRISWPANARWKKPCSPSTNSITREQMNPL